MITDLRRVLPLQGERLRAGGGELGSVALELERHLERHAQVRIVVDDENLRRHLRQSSVWNGNL